MKNRIIFIPVAIVISAIVGIIGSWMDWYTVMPAIMLFLGLMFGAVQDEVDSTSDNLIGVFVLLIVGLIIGAIVGGGYSGGVSSYYFYSTLLSFLFPAVGFTLVQWIRDASYDDPFES